jgi:hypothetical protein
VSLYTAQQNPLRLISKRDPQLHNIISKIECYLQGVTVQQLLRFLLLSVFSLSAVSAQDATPAWKMTNVQPLQAVIGTDYPPTAQPFLAPDGSAVAWNTLKDSIALYNFDEGTTSTYPVPESFTGFGPYSSPSWSPDAQHFTFTESAFDRLLESDIWMLDHDSGDITNRTDDGLFGGWLKLEEPADIDYLPTWNPTNGDLYFFRSRWSQDSDKTLGLYLLPVDRDEPKLVADLTAQLPVLSVYRPAVISPDGTHIAFIVLGQDIADTRNGLWVMDLKTAVTEQLTSVEDLRIGLPSFQTESALLPDSLQWAGDNALVVLSRDNQNLAQVGVVQMAYYVDLATHGVTPLAQFEDITQLSDLFLIDERSPALRIPRSGLVAPDGSAFFFLRYGPTGSDMAGISMLPLPPDGSAPVELGEIEDFGLYPASSVPPVISADGRGLMYGYLFQFEKS